jgi:GNAT superfamily N-acetyltransferase
MDRAEVLGLFDGTMRAAPWVEAGTRLEWAGQVLRRLGAQNFIEWWSLDAAGARAAVEAEAAHFRAIGERVEWKVYSHDGPAALEGELARAGFEPDDLETFMVFDLEGGTLEGPEAEGVEIGRAADEEGLADLMATNTAAFGREQAWLAAELKARLADPTLSLYVAYLEGRPVASGRLEMAPGRAFAGLYGGGVAPAYRGKGIYRALVAARAREARRRGYRYLTVDAAVTSAPILKRLGFEALARVRGWVLGALSC